MMSRLLSPCQFNPLHMNPLQDILDSCVDFSRVHECSDIKLFISATNVETGRVKIFDSHHLTAVMVMASACLPQMFQAGVIDGVTYWDDGYMGKAPLSGWSDTLTISERAVRLICGLCSSAGRPR